MKILDSMVTKRVAISYLLLGAVDAERSSNAVRNEAEELFTP